MDIEFYIFLIVVGLFGLGLSINDLKNPKKKVEHIAYRTNYFILFLWSSICILIALAYFMKSYLI